MTHVMRTMPRPLAAVLVALWLMLAAVGAGFAQEPLTDADYSRWDQQADAAEAAVDRGTAADARLRELRAEVVDWRERFSAAQSTNAPRIASVRQQIEALGPAPAEGETEASDVAARRKLLNDQLAELQSPGVRAVEAFSRADNIVRGIDELQRDRQASAVLGLSPSPLLPSSWAAASDDGMAIIGGLADDLRAGSRAEADLRRLPVILGYVLLALLLLVYGRRWVDSLPSRLSARASEYSRDALNFVVSLAQIVIPAAGVYLAARAVDATGMAGDWGRPILMALPIGGLIFFAGVWLSRRFFPEHSDPPICYPEQRRQKGKFYTALTGGALALHHIASRAALPLSGWRSGAEPGNGAIPLRVDEAAASVFHLPLILLGALVLFKLSMVLRGSSKYALPDTPGYRARTVGVLGGLARAVAIAAPVLALIGYVSLSNALLWPTALTIGTVMLIILLQEFIADLYSLAKRDSTGSRDALAPVLIGFALVLASLPVFGLIWGARMSDLGEAWTRIRQGVSLGGIRLSPGSILMFIVVFTIGYFLTRLIQGTFRNSILPRTKLDAGAQNAAVSGLGYVGIFIAALLAITSAGIDLSNLAIVAGALSVGIGFGMQNIVSNFASGIILLVERPVAVGDWIQVGAAQGYVKRISVRSTQIQTFDRTDVIVPNSDLISQQVTNWTRGNQQGRIIVPVGVAYGSDTRKVAAVLKEIAEDQPIVLINPPPAIAFVGFGADSLDFEVRAILSDINQGLGVQTEMRHQIIERFAREGIEIPFAHREVRIVNADQIPGPLAGRPPSRAGAPAPSKAETPSGQTGGGDLSDPQDARIAHAASSGLEDAAGSNDADGDGDGARG